MGSSITPELTCPGTYHDILAYSCRVSVTHVIEQLLQVLLQLKEVDSSDEALASFGQAVPGQLCYLMVDEADDPVGQRQHALRGEGIDELC